MNLSEFLSSKNPNLFIATLSLVESRLNSNLPDGYRRIWVEGTQKGSVSLCITAFPTIGEYRFVFHTIKNFRNIKNDMNEELIDTIVSGYENTIRDLLK